MLVLGEAPEFVCYCGERPSRMRRLRGRKSQWNTLQEVAGGPEHMLKEGPGKRRATFSNASGGKVRVTRCLLQKLKMKIGGRRRAFLSDGFSHLSKVGSDGIC